MTQPTFLAHRWRIEAEGKRVERVACGRPLGPLFTVASRKARRVAEQVRASLLRIVERTTGHSCADQSAAGRQILLIECIWKTI
jgi:hypothetical protein